jgi:hypothetical protein
MQNRTPLGVGSPPTPSETSSVCNTASGKSSLSYKSFQSLFRQTAPTIIYKHKKKATQSPHQAAFFHLYKN